MAHITHRLALFVSLLPGTTMTISPALIVFITLISRAFGEISVAVATIKNVIVVPSPMFVGSPMTL